MLVILGKRAEKDGKTCYLQGIDASGWDAVIFLPPNTTTSAP